jgi:hypothetical protein
MENLESDILCLFCRFKYTGPDGSTTLDFRYRKFQIDTLGNHLCTCISHLGDKKVHDWVVYQITDLFLTIHKVKM